MVISRGTLALLLWALLLMSLLCLYQGAVNLEQRRLIRLLWADCSHPRT